MNFIRSSVIKTIQVRSAVPAALLGSEEQEASVKTTGMDEIMAKEPSNSKFP